MNFYAWPRVNQGLALISILTALECSLLSTMAGVSILNDSFEDISGETPFNEFTFGPLNGWNLYDPNGVTDAGDGPTFFIGTLTPTEPDPIGNPGVHAFFPGGAPDGNRVGIAFNFAGSGGLGEYGFTQTLTDTLLPFMTYTLQVDIGNIASGQAVSGDFFNLDGFPGYRVDLLAGGVVIAQDLNSLANTIPEGQFATSSFDFYSDGTHPQTGQPLGIRLVNLNQIDPLFPDADLEVDFDHVRLFATPIPEPTTHLIISILLLTLAPLVRKWKRLPQPNPCKQ